MGLERTEKFDRIWDKASRWLTDDEFHLWLCRCYGSMSVCADDETLIRAVDGGVYEMIINRKGK